MKQLKKISFIINGQHREMSIPSSLLLIDLIREELGLKGTKPGCLEGECGACTVLVAGEPVNSCLFLAVNIHDREITTIEGLSGAGDNSLDQVQEALVQHGAVQCGFCSPGMALTIKAYHSHCQAEQIVPGKSEIKNALAGNLCRCTGYVKIIEAVDSLFGKS